MCVLGSLLLTAVVLRAHLRGPRRLLRDLQADRERERARLSRELHDVVGHGLTVISLHARCARDDPGTLDAVDRTAQEVLAEVGAIVADLRGSGRTAPAEAPAPVGGRIARTADTLRAAGVPVRVELAGPDRAVPPGVGRTAERAVREALINSAKHAPGRPVSVRVDLASGIGIDVRSGPGDVPARRPSPAGAGAGLAGLAAALADHGGRLAHGPLPGGGYRFTAWLPPVWAVPPTGTPTGAPGALTTTDGRRR
jgi:signal transduction histidine kinase